MSNDAMWLLQFGVILGFGFLYLGAAALLEHFGKAPVTRLSLGVVGLVCVVAAPFLAKGN